MKNLSRLPTAIRKLLLLLESPYKRIIKQAEPAFKMSDFSPFKLHSFITVTLSLNIQFCYLVTMLAKPAFTALQQKHDSFESYSKHFYQAAQRERTENSSLIYPPGVFVLTDSISSSTGTVCLSF